MDRPLAARLRRALLVLRHSSDRLAGALPLIGLVGAALASIAGRRWC